MTEGASSPLPFEEGALHESVILIMAVAQGARRSEQRPGPLLAGVLGTRGRAGSCDSRAPTVLSVSSVGSRCPAVAASAG